MQIQITLDIGGDNSHIAEMIVSVSRGPTLVAEAANSDMYRAIDLAVDKIESQLKNTKERSSRGLSEEKGLQLLKWRVLEVNRKHNGKRFYWRNFVV